MQTELVQIQNTKPPKPGSKYTNWSVFGSNDEFFVIAPQFVSQLQAGQTYNLTYEFAGKAKKIIGINGNALQDGPAPIGATTAQLDPVKQAEQALAKAKAEAAQKAKAAQASQHQADMTSAHIFVTGVVQRAAQFGLAPAMWEDAAVAAAKAYKAACAELESRSLDNGPAREMGHGMPDDGPPMDDFPADFVQ